MDWVDDDEGGRTTTGEPPPQAAKNPDMAMTIATATRSARERITRGKRRGDGVRSIATSSTVLKRLTLYTMNGVAEPFQGPRARMLVSYRFSATYGPSVLCVLDVGGNDGRGVGEPALRWMDVGFDADTLTFQRSLIEGVDGPTLAPTKTRRSHRLVLDGQPQTFFATSSMIGPVPIPMV